MTNPLARILDALDPGAPAKAAAITGQNAPTVDQLAADSAASAALFGGGDADDPPPPNTVPVYEPERPVVDDIEVGIVRGLRSYLLGVPVPAASASFTARPDPNGFGVPVQVVPASGGKPRRVTIRNVSGFSVAVQLYTERSGSNGTATPPDGGYRLPDGAELVTNTQGPIFAASGFDWTLTAWVDTYPEPVT